MERRPKIVWEVFATIIILCFVVTTAFLLQERAGMQAAHRHSDELIDDLQSAGKIGSWEVDLDTGAIIWSREMFLLNECEPALGPPSLEEWLQRIHPIDRAACRAKFDQARTEGTPFVFDARILSPRGVSVWTRMTGKTRPQTADRKARLVGTVMDIGNHKAAVDLVHDYRMLFEPKVVPQSGTDAEVSLSIDSLTGVAHHHVLVEALEKEISRAIRYEASLSLILVTVDNAQQEESHDTGQHLLRQLAGVLQIQARTSDMVARYGGRGFALILPATNADGALVAADRVRKAIAASNGPIRSAGISLGIAQFPTAQTAADLIALANEALQRARHDEVVERP